MKPVAPRHLFAALKRALLRAFKAVVVVLLVIIPVPIAALFARGGKGPKDNLPGQVLRREDEDPP